MTIKTGDLARRLDIHENTVRAWADQYSAFMSPGALAAKRKFSDHDGLVLATVADLRSKGLTSVQITEALTSGKLVESLPELPSPEETAARASVALVPLAEYQRLADLVRTKEDELSRVLAERDAALISASEASKQIADLREQVGDLRGKLEIMTTMESERLPVRVVLQIVIALAVVALLIVAAAVVILAGRGG